MPVAPGPPTTSPLSPLAPSAIRETGDKKFLKRQLFNSYLYEGLPVNKTELIEHIAKHADISKAAATRALESMIGAVKTTLKKGGSVSLVGFGTFAVGKRAARSGRNPRTGAQIKIKAAKVPKFRPGKALKDALN
jgi:DNA-binding protein HU-beta